MKYLKIIIIPVLFALLLRIIFGASIFDDFFSVMTWTFFLLVPAAIGALTVYYSSIEKVKSVNYRFFCAMAAYYIGHFVNHINWFGRLGVLDNDFTFILDF
jgi:hypothetical protein